MSNPNQSPVAAMNQADQFVRSQFNLAKTLLKEGKVDEAYYQFGIGLHTLQDATSPAHRGFQTWSGKEAPSEIVAHVASELIYPGKGSNLQMITNKYFDWFQNSNASLPAGNLFANIKSD